MGGWGASWSACACGSRRGWVREWQCCVAGADALRCTWEGVSAEGGGEKKGTDSVSDRVNDLSHSTALVNTAAAPRSALVTYRERNTQRASRRCVNGSATQAQSETSARGPAARTSPTRTCSSTCAPQCALPPPPVSNVPHGGEQEEDGRCSPLSRCATSPCTSPNRAPHSSHSHVSVPPAAVPAGRSDLPLGSGATRVSTELRTPLALPSRPAAPAACAADVSDDAGDREREPGDVVPSMPIMWITLGLLA